MSTGSMLGDAFSKGRHPAGARESAGVEQPGRRGGHQRRRRHVPAGLATGINAFAMMEAILILAAIAQRFRLILTPGQQVVPTPYITLRPEPGVHVRLERR